MAIYIVTSHEGSDPQKLLKQVSEKYPKTNYKLNNNTFLVASPLKLQELSDDLGITSPDSITGGIVIPVSNYYGLAPTNIWAWIKSNWEASNHGTE